LHAHLSGALRQADVMPLAAMAAAAAAAEQRLRGLQAGAPGGAPAGAGAGAEPARAAPASTVDPGLLPALQAALRCAQRTGCASGREGSLRAGASLLLFAVVLRCARRPAAGESHHTGLSSTLERPGAIYAPRCGRRARPRRCRALRGAPTQPGASITTSARVAATLLPPLAGQPRRRTPGWARPQRRPRRPRAPRRTRSARWAPCSAAPRRCWARAARPRAAWPPPSSAWRCAPREACTSGLPT